VSLEHHKRNSLTEANAQGTTNENGRIHNLVFGLVGPEELYDTNDNQSKKDGRPYIKIDHNPTHFFAEEVSHH
jgi:hypothetical protein